MKFFKEYHFNELIHQQLSCGSLLCKSMTVQSSTSWQICCQRNVFHLWQYVKAQSVQPQF